MFGLFKKKSKESAPKEDQVKTVADLTDIELDSSTSFSKEVADEKMSRAISNLSTPMEKDLVNALNSSDMPCYVELENGRLIPKHELFDLEDPHLYCKKKMLDLFVLSANLPNGRNVLLDNPVEKNLEIANRLIVNAFQSNENILTLKEFQFLLSIPSILNSEEINQFYNVEPEEPAVFDPDEMPDMDEMEEV